MKDKSTLLKRVNYLKNIIGWQDRNKRFAAILFGLLFLWFTYGSFFHKKEIHQKPMDTVFNVGIYKFPMEKERPTLRLQGKVTSIRELFIYPEITRGRIDKIMVEKGSKITKGQIIATIFPEELNAKLDEAKALLKQRELEYDAAIKLAVKSYRSKTNVAKAKAALEAAKARVAQVQYDLENTNIKAPFDGIIDDLYIEVGSLVSSSTKVAKYLDNSKLKVSFDIPELEIKNVHKGQGAKISHKKNYLDAQIIYTAAKADDITRTFKAEAIIIDSSKDSKEQENSDSNDNNNGNNQELNLKPGNTVSVEIIQDPVDAYKIPISLIVLSDNGKIGVRYVDENNKVQFAKIKIVKHDSKFVTITGIPEDTAFIVSGQEFVSSGQRVETTYITKDNYKEFFKNIRI